MSEPTQTIEGWYAYHEFRTIDWPLWKSIAQAERLDIIENYLTYEKEQKSIGAKREGSYSLYKIAGDKADLLFVYFTQDLEGLISSKYALNKTKLADYTNAVYSYTSVVELSSYLSKPGTDPLEDPQLQPRLMPDLTSMAPHICFYPMNKKRDGQDNWYMLDKSSRTDMMRSHGMIGRSYADKVTQIITGSVGLDDWEWGVTLFAEDPLQFKKLVYEMRFDEVSARYAEFGPFYVGKVATEKDLRSILEV